MTSVGVVGSPAVVGGIKLVGWREAFIHSTVQVMVLKRRSISCGYLAQLTEHSG